MSEQFEVLAVGGGISGLSAALQAARLGRKTLLVTGDVFGGHLLSVDTIDGYPGYPDGIAGYELCPIAQGQAVEAGAEVRSGELIELAHENGGWRARLGDGELTAKAVILATGTSMRPLDVPGAAAFIGKGVSHCASCDAPLMRDKPVVVVGGGDSALQEALHLADSAARVDVLHHGEGPSAQQDYVARATAHPKIHFQAHAEVEEILGAKTVTAVRRRHLADGQITEIEAEGVFVYIGLDPNTAFLKDHLDLDASNRIVTDGALGTKLPGIFAAGTVRAGAAGRAIAAAGDGTLAALSADTYLRDNA